MGEVVESSECKVDSTLSTHTHFTLFCFTYVLSTLSATSSSTSATSATSSTSTTSSSFALLYFAASAALNFKCKVHAAKEEAKRNNP